MNDQEEKSIMTRVEITTIAVKKSRNRKLSYKGGGINGEKVAKGQENLEKAAVVPHHSHPIGIHLRWPAVTDWLLLC
jgi:hypothetical protein